MPVRVVLAEGTASSSGEGLEQLLATAPEVDVVASCDELGSLMSAIEEHAPDVVLTDIRMPPTRTDEGIRIAIALRDERPDVGVVVLIQYPEPGCVLPPTGV